MTVSPNAKTAAAAKKGSAKVNDSSGMIEVSEQEAPKALKAQPKRAPRTARGDPDRSPDSEVRQGDRL
jgi:hypothetical protein